MVIAGAKARTTASSATSSSTNPPLRLPQQPRGAAQVFRDSEMIGKTVKIRKGRWKGYLGMVVEEAETKVKVEIHSKSCCVSVDKALINLAGTRHGHIEDHPRASATPMVGSGMMTPMVSGSMTPMMASGSMTPLHPSSGNLMTSSTPGNDSWNPASAASSSSSSGNLNHTTNNSIHTPSSSNHNTSGLNTPGMIIHTPSSSAAAFHNEQDLAYASSYGTPLEPVTTPALMGGSSSHSSNHLQSNMTATPLGYHHPATPGGGLLSSSYSPAPEAGGYGSTNVVATPGGFPTPSAHHHPTTPGVYPHSGHHPGLYHPNSTPHYTPGGESPMPATPYGGTTPHQENSTHSSSLVQQQRQQSPQQHLASSSSSSSWVCPDIVVTVASSGNLGIIRQVESSSGCCVVELLTSSGALSGKTERVLPEGLEAVIPEKHNRIKVLSEERKGQTGSLIGTDGGDGIVKMDGTAEIIIYALHLLGKLA